MKSVAVLGGKGSAPPPFAHEVDFLTLAGLKNHSKIQGGAGAREPGGGQGGQFPPPQLFVSMG